MSELTILSKLQPARQIISIGRVPIFVDIERTENININADQLARDAVVTTKAAIVADAADAANTPDEPKKKMTKAEQRRERVRKQREEYAKAAEENEDRPVHLAAPIVPRERVDPIAGLRDVMGRLHDRVQAVNVNAIDHLRERAPAVNANAANPAETEAAYNMMSQDARERSFWATIAKLNWRNASDGHIGAAAVGAVFNTLPAIDIKVFKEQYTHLFEQTRMILEADGMFARNRLETMSAQAKIVSHAIAMGADQYRTLTADPEIFQFFVDSGECQSLNEVLPAELRI